MKIEAKRRLLEAWRLDVRMAVMPASFTDILEHPVDRVHLPNTKSYTIQEVFGKDLPYQSLSTDQEFQPSFATQNRGAPFRLQTPKGEVFVDPNRGNRIRYAGIIK